MLSATLGVHWELVQSVAWVGMIVNYSRQTSLSEAVSKTFDGQHPCCLCKLIRAGKSQEKKHDAWQTVKNIDLFADAGAVFFFPDRLTPRFSATHLIFSRNESPPSPPPRPLFG